MAGNHERSPAICKFELLAEKVKFQQLVSTRTFVMPRLSLRSISSECATCQDLEMCGKYCIYTQPHLHIHKKRQMEIFEPKPDGILRKFEDKRVGVDKLFGCRHLRN